MNRLLVWSLIFMFGSQSAATAMAQCGVQVGWYVAIHELLQDLKIRDDKVHLLPCPRIVREGVFELSNVGYSCSIVRQAEVISEVNCTNLSGERIQFKTPRRRFDYSEICDQDDQITDSHFQEVVIRKNEKSATFEIRFGSDRSCIFKLNQAVPTGTNIP